MAKQSKIIVGQVAAITGGARGIGKETARALVREGVRVAIGDLDLAAATQAAEEIGGGTIGARARTSPTATRSCASSTRPRPSSGPLDILVNNAGIMQLGAYLDEDERTTKRMIDINIYGVHYGTTIALERFVPRGRGHLDQHRLDGRQGRLCLRCHVLRHQALRRRHERGAARRAARHAGRDLGRDARRRSTPSSGPGSRRLAASRRSSRRTSRARSSRCSRSPASTSSSRARSVR